MPDGATSISGVQLSDSAARRIAELRDSEGNAALMLRLAVLGGGCSGFQYKFDLDDAINDDDRIFENGDVKLVVDEVSLGLLEGSLVDFKEDLGGSFFAVENPNAAANCGCGASLSV
jgi:iron-sulfur cluster insertion protein